MPDTSHFSFADQIDAVLAERRMLDHSFYQAWSEGRLPQKTLQAYAQQYFHHVDAFPRYVSATHCLAEDREARKMLAENLAEEEGLEEGKTDHPELWMQFAEGMGAKRAEVEATELYPETRKLIDTFTTLSRKSYAAGLAALYAYEAQIPDVATTKIDGLKKFYDADDADTLRFFTVHEKADIEHAEICRNLLDKLSPAEQAEALEAAKENANALLGFLSGVERECVVLDQPVLN